jgi:spoIIIJ-associated protein
VVPVPDDAASAETVARPRQEEIEKQNSKERDPLMSAPRPKLIVDGKLDHSATTAELRRCIDILLRKGRFELLYDIRTTQPAAAADLENPEILVVFRGRDQDLLLERNAELLKALEHIAIRSLWLAPQVYGRIRFDAGGYRALRIEELKLSAHIAADRVRETHSPFRFNAMSARERRILHLALKEEPGVRTLSDGAGEERSVVVYPANG